MPNWKGIIIGDAFKVSPGGFDHYRDLFLMWPFLLFSIVAISNLFSSQLSYRSYGLKCALCAVVAIVLAKERLILFLGALAYLAVRLTIAFIVVHDWRALLALLLSGGIFFAVVRSGALANWRPSYPRERDFHSLDLIVGMSGVVLAVAITMWMKP